MVWILGLLNVIQLGILVKFYNKTTNVLSKQVSVEQERLTQLIYSTLDRRNE